MERGVEKIPDGISFERATLVEPLNTCLKAAVQCDPQPDDVVLILGQGPIGLMFTRLLALRAMKVVATDLLPARLELARTFGACRVFQGAAQNFTEGINRLTQGRGLDAAIVTA